MSDVEAAHGVAADPNRYFDELTREQKESAIRRMRRDGHSEYQIAHATRLSVEQVRQVLALVNRA